VTRAEWITFITDYLFNELDIVSITNGFTKFMNCSVDQKAVYTVDAKDGSNEYMPEEDETTIIIFDHIKNREIKSITVPGIANDITYDPVGECFYTCGTKINRIAAFDPALEPRLDTSVKEFSLSSDDEWTEPLVRGLDQFKLMSSQEMEVVGDFGLRVVAPPKLEKVVDVETLDETPPTFEEIQKETTIAVSHYFGVALYKSPLYAPGDEAHPLQRYDLTQPRMGADLAFGADRGLWVSGHSRSIKKGETPVMFRIDVPQCDVPETDDPGKFRFEEVESSGVRVNGVAMDTVYSSRCSWSATEDALECVSRLSECHVSLKLPDKTAQMWMEPTLVECCRLKKSSLSTSEEYVVEKEDGGKVQIPKVKGFHAKKYRSGRTYTGEWNQGEYSGWGVEKTSNGEYHGEWLNGYKWGYGRYIDQTGCYTGYWKLGRKHDVMLRACMRFRQPHAEIRFEWRQDSTGRSSPQPNPNPNPNFRPDSPGRSSPQRVRQGILPTPRKAESPSGRRGGLSREKEEDYDWMESGERYYGQYTDDLLTGHGRKTFHSNNVYTGEWVDGEPEGDGKYTWEDGTWYEGQFESGREHGLGEMLSSKTVRGQPGSRVFKGVFNKGKKERCCPPGMALPPTKGRQRSGNPMPGYSNLYPPVRGGSLSLPSTEAPRSPGPVKSVNVSKQRDDHDPPTGADRTLRRTAALPLH